MIRSFSIEWIKVRSYRTFWILLGAFLLLFPLTFYFVAVRYNEATSRHSGQVFKQIIQNPFAFPRVWLSSSYFAGLFFVMIGMLFILLITNEFQYRTHRQNIIDGWSRFDFLKAKLAMLIFLVLVSTTLVFVAGFTVGKIFTPAGQYDMTAGLQYVGYFALMAAAYLTLAYLIAIFVKRTGFAIIIYFALACIGDNFLWLILTLKDSQIGFFLPLECTDSLIPNPFKPPTFEKRTVSDGELLTAASCYLTLFGALIATYFKRMDLKN